MPDTLLIIDGRGRPDALVEALEAAGYFCVYARGPLKAKALLREHPVALILWKDNTGNAELSKDLGRIWKIHPRIPVVHLIAYGLHPVPIDLGPQVRATLPVESPAERLLDVIRAGLSAGRPSAPSELDVLGTAVPRDVAPERLALPGSRHPAIAAVSPVTAVSADERQFLYGPLLSPAAGRPGLLDWVRARLSRLRAASPEP